MISSPFDEFLREFTLNLHKHSQITPAVPGSMLQFTKSYSTKLFNPSATLTNSPFPIVSIVEHNMPACPVVVVGSLQK